MTTLAADKARDFGLGLISEHPVIASDIIYEGAAGGENGSGYARPLVAGDPFLGFGESKADNSAGSAGDKNVRVRTEGLVQLSVSGLAITDVGRPVYASDDDTFTFSAPGNSFIGVVQRYVSSGVGIIKYKALGVDEFGPNPNRVLKSADYTVLSTDNGKIIYVDTDTKIITLLATVAGFEVTIVNAGAAGAALIEVDPDAADKSLGGCGMAAGGDGKKLSNTKATAKRGDYLKLVGDGAAGWNIVDKRGTWATES